MNTDCKHVCMHAKSPQSCLTLRDTMDCSPPGFSVHGILQASILEWVAMPSSGDLPDPGIEPASLWSPALAGGFFTPRATWEASGTEEDKTVLFEASKFVIICDRGHRK